MKQGHEILVCYSSSLPIDAGKYPYNVFTAYIPEIPALEFKTIHSIYQRILQYRPDAVINNDNMYISDLWPSLPPECLRVNVVHGYRDNLGWDPINSMNKAAAYNHEYLDWIAAISGVMREGMVSRFGLPDEQVRLVYNGYEPSEDFFVSPQRRLIDKEVKFLFVGGHGHLKAADIFLKAVKSLNSSGPGKIKIIWAGSLPERGKFSREAIASLGIVDVRGRLPREELMRILAGCHYLVQPSRVEACPMILLEALSLGVVPIVSDCASAMREIVRDADCGEIVRVGDVRGLVGTIQSSSLPGERWVEMSARGREYFFKNLHLDVCGNKLLELCTHPRVGRNMSPVQFPPPGMLPFHRKPYRGSFLKPGNIAQRFRFFRGDLPGKLKYPQGRQGIVK